MMSKKLYYAYVEMNMVNHFEEALKERADKITVCYLNPAFSEKGRPLVRYVLEAEEGIIDPKWELR